MQRKNLTKLQFLLLFHVSRKQAVGRQIYDEIMTVKKNLFIKLVCKHRLALSDDPRRPHREILIRLTLVEASYR